MNTKISQLILFLLGIPIFEQATMATQTASNNPKSRQDILKEIEEKLTGRQAVKNDLPEEEMSRIKKLSTYLNPSSLKATFNKLTDNLHLTNNRRKTEEDLIKIRAQRKIEEQNFDTIIKKLQARFLNRMILGSQDALDKVQKIKNKQLTLEGYKAQLNKDIQDAKDLLTKKEFLGVPLTDKKKMNQYSKDLQGRQARQAIYIQKLTVRLDTFEKTYNNPENAKRELEAMKKEMLELSPTQKPKPADSTSPVDESMKQIQGQVGALTQRLNALEKQVAALTGKAQGAR